MGISKTRKIFLLIFVCVGFFDFGLLLSLQPTFYPSEAEAKGATPSQYGFVFGIVNFAAFIAAPILGRYGDTIGPKLLYNTGGLVQGIGGICFGLLEFSNVTGIFIGFSYLLRFLEGIANAACNSTVNGILLAMFPGKASSIMGYTRMFLGLGYMLGPAIGSALFTAGGFGLPFYVVGSMTTFVALVLLFLLPKKKKLLEGNEYKKLDDNDEEERETNKPSLSFSVVIKYPLMVLPFLDAVTCFMGNGMVEAMLEPHLKDDAHATQGQIALTFLILGGMYTFTFPIGGYIGDRLKTKTVCLSVMGNVLITLVFTFIGPLPFLPIEPTAHLIYICVAMAGCGYSLIAVSSFTRAFQTALKRGFADSMRTNLIISGLWASSFNLGNFIGPTSAGFIVEAYGFRDATFVYIWIYVIMIFVDVGVLIYECRSSSAYEELK